MEETFAGQKYIDKIYFENMIDLHSDS